ncbi:MAG: RlmE family RNA methyltransferase [Rhodobacteraceae bacterium]|nr:RlmE family RNA methyltransferase [Paracoccaceae bacterium]MCY4195387.1 RlmE family RNA methyltransferase [Paracoccaceae bacterium]MCY4327120.1 RlmE family RNA methyltransferase [Paracoccaceae bacterium]
MVVRQTSGRGERDLKVRVKSAKNRPVGSTRWLERQLNDPYVKRARREGWRSRAAYKLMEIDDKYRILRPGMVVLDLGCKPGGWCQVASLRVNALEEQQSNSRGRVIGIDLETTEPIAGADLHVMDFLDEDAVEQIHSILGTAPHVILSDMAAPMIGHKQTDQLRTLLLAEATFSLACEILAANGSMVAKVMSGGASPDLQNRLKQAFQKVHNVKPPASRAGSSERYVVAQGFRLR